MVLGISRRESELLKGSEGPRAFHNRAGQKRPKWEVGALPGMCSPAHSREPHTVSRSAGAPGPLSEGRILSWGRVRCRGAGGLSCGNRFEGKGTAARVGDERVGGRGEGVLISLGTTFWGDLEYTLRDSSKQYNYFSLCLAAHVNFGNSAWLGDQATEVTGITTGP